MVSDKFWEYTQKHSIFKPKDVESFGLKRIELSRLVSSGKILKISHGLYSIPGIEYNENTSIIEVFKRIPKAVLSHLSALQFHGITTQLPHEIWVTVRNKTWIPKIDNLNIVVTRINEKNFNRDVEIHEIDNMNIKVYSIARTCSDCFKSRNKLGLDIAIEALKETILQKKASVSEIVNAAKYCRTFLLMKPYIEAIVST